MTFRRAKGKYRLINIYEICSKSGLTFKMFYYTDRHEAKLVPLFKVRNVFANAYRRIPFSGEGSRLQVTFKSDVVDHLPPSDFPLCDHMGPFRVNSDLKFCPDLV